MADENRSHLPTSVAVVVDEVRRWQVDVVERLAAAGLAVALRSVAAEAPIAGVDLLFAFDRLFVGRSVATPADRAPPPEAVATAPARLIVDLTGALPPDPRVPVLRVGCLGLPPLAGALTAILDEVVPVLEIERIDPGAAPRMVARWAVGVEDRRNTLVAVSQILARLAQMVVVAVADARRGGEGAALVAPVPSRSMPEGGLAPALLVRSLGARVLGRLERAIRRPADWRVIWRRRDRVADVLHPESDHAPFHLLRDDGRRFYADPFVVTEAGRTWLFVEEFPYATGRGVLSVAEIEDGGAIARPRPFLEEDCHLSYPQIFADGGEIWMVPETSGRRTVELWRAVGFPDRWEKHAVLLDGVDVGDATLVRHGGLWWMFGCAREPWCSSWDALHLWHAPALTGPWTPHPIAPALVDVASARPAGAVVATAEGLFRPVQDSSRRYGGGLALARIDRLDPERFAETVVKRFATPAPLSGLHTWNRAATAGDLVEVMDVFCRPDDFGPSRRLHLAG